MEARAGRGASIRTRRLGTSFGIRESGRARMRWRFELDSVGAGGVVNHYKKDYETAVHHNYTSIPICRCHYCCVRCHLPVTQLHSLVQAPSLLGCVQTTTTTAHQIALSHAIHHPTITTSKSSLGLPDAAASTMATRLPSALRALSRPATTSSTSFAQSTLARRNFQTSRTLRADAVVSPRKPIGAFRGSYVSPPATNN